MPRSQSRVLLDELLAEREPERRLIDICLVLRSLETRETVLWAGGRWDRLDRRWLKQDPESAQIIDIHEGQLPFVKWYAEWLRDYREGFPRDVSLALAGGARRGGKTFGLLQCALATLIDVPATRGAPTIGWLVSVAHSERDEIDKAVQRTLLPEWFTYREWPRHVYKFVHGSEAVNVSADDPESLKKGKVDVLLLNEAQKMPSAALTNALSGTEDTEGIALLAANPPQRSRGEWVFDLQEEIVSGEYGPEARFFHFDPALNPFISQRAKQRVAKILRKINPAAAEADEDGIWRRPGELAYEAFSRVHNVKPCPDLGDITVELTKRRLGKGYQYVGGYDPNNRPHHVGTIWKVYGTLQDPIMWCVDEVVVDHADGEDHFLEVVDSKGYGVDDIVWIMDNSSFFQDSKRRVGHVSADYFRKWGYRPEPNQPAAPGSKTGRPRNPDIELRVALLNKLLHADVDEKTGLVLRPPRLLVDPQCTALVEGLKNCKSKKVRHGYGPIGKHSHITDSAGYAAWWLFPRPQRKGAQDGPLALLGPKRTVSFFGGE